MRIDKLAMTSREALQNAIGIASDAQAASVEPIHLLAALLTSGERNISVIIERIGADPKQLASATQQLSTAPPRSKALSSSSVAISPACLSALRKRPPRWTTTSW